MADQYVGIQTTEGTLHVGLNTPGRACPTIAVQKDGAIHVLGRFYSAEDAELAVRFIRRLVGDPVEEGETWEDWNG